MALGDELKKISSASYQRIEAEREEAERKRKAEAKRKREKDEKRERERLEKERKQLEERQKIIPQLIDELIDEFLEFLKAYAGEHGSRSYEGVCYRKDPDPDTRSRMHPFKAINLAHVYRKADFKYFGSLPVYDFSSGEIEEFKNKLRERLSNERIRVNYIKTEEYKEYYKSVDSRPPKPYQIVEVKIKVSW